MTTLAIIVSTIFEVLQIAAIIYLIVKICNAKSESEVLGYFIFLLGVASPYLFK